MSISILKTEVGVNMGDHAQDMTRACEADPDETVGALVERLLVTRGYVPPGSKPDPDYDSYLTIRVAEPKTEEER